MYNQPQMSFVASILCTRHDWRFARVLTYEFSRRKKTLCCSSSFPFLSTPLAHRSVTPPLFFSSAAMRISLLVLLVAALCLAVATVTVRADQGQTHCDSAASDRRGSNVTAESSGCVPVKLTITHPPAPNHSFKSQSLTHSLTHSQPPPLSLARCSLPVAQMRSA